MLPASIRKIVFAVVACLALVAGGAAGVLAAGSLLGPCEEEAGERSERGSEAPLRTEMERSRRSEVRWEAPAHLLARERPLVRPVPAASATRPRAPAPDCWVRPLRC